MVVLFYPKKSRRFTRQKPQEMVLYRALTAHTHKLHCEFVFVLIFLMFRSKLLWFSMKFLKPRSNSYRVFFNHFRQRREKWPQIYGNHHYSKLSLKSQDKLPPRLLMEILCKKWLSAVLINNAVVFASSQDKETPLP